MQPNQALPGQRLCLFFDGTWNEPGSHTNVWRLYLMLGLTGRDGVSQKTFYEEGVGTHWYDRVSGGAFGTGLPQNIRGAYRWLMEHYNPGDEIFLFGFSRGAFTARSLAGLIARCGILRPEAALSFTQLYSRYEKGEQVRPIYQLIREKATLKNLDFEEKVLLDHSYYRRNLIKMIGVWDTVGSLGVPGSRRSSKYHNTHLSMVVQNAYQALATDEYRQPYWAILWTTFVPEAKEPELRPDERMIEQRWFSGAHANVGGGYAADLLPQRPLRWIQSKAEGCGLKFRSHITPDDDDMLMHERDSYAEFLRGFWRVATLGRRYTRWIMSDPVKKLTVLDGKQRAGHVKTVNERIDLSVFRRCQKYPEYRPAGLREWAARKGKNLDEVITEPERFAELWNPVVTKGIE
ncbi:MAG TPA: DUF2235 domain-containing protein [Blastocatellia bacterium]|nr:DUF2235 domain-containing protein [Blastocatellia bacterium]